MYRWNAYSMSFAYLSKAPEVLLVLESRGGGTSVLTDVIVYEILSRVSTSILHPFEA